VRGDCVPAASSEFPGLSEEPAFSGSPEEGAEGELGSCGGE
jgi:hypothetical protein